MSIVTSNFFQKTYNYGVRINIVLDVCPLSLPRFNLVVIKLHRMHEMQTIVTDVRGVCQSVCHAA